MKIAVYGAGYVGLVSSACLASLGHDVLCADLNQERVDALLSGHCPIHEKNLPELLHEQTQAGRLQFSADIEKTIDFADIHFIAVGTPGLADGRADLSQVEAVVKTITQLASRDCFIICKSTVPVGTGERLEILVKEQLQSLNKTITVELASNPEFLREGSAVFDFLNADRIIVGGEPSAITCLQAIYQPLINKGIPFLPMSRCSAELTKYSANAMLASRISFMNQISQIAEAAGANIEDIRRGMALDERIGPHFLNAGIGYGGSCFPKDVRALAETAADLRLDPVLLNAIDQTNTQQKNWVIKQLMKHFNNRLSGLKIGFWGLSFKPDTDDLREASSLTAIQSVLRADAMVVAYDPAAIDSARLLFQGEHNIVWAKTAEEVLNSGLDALVIATEWSEFKNYSLQKMKRCIKQAAVFDGRNCYDLRAVEEARLHHYYSVGRPVVTGLND
ncbi:UDP-glucose 6-dehydrogenase [Legionella birminghamensis]|uniref:UDP-glucose 6-dehydrogenase n=1 Tax=Legionella birminghamensis TaxID=28083 RepID=A0A378I8Z0_9GAMM|nr:UDP-glucose/GDP-mannose dehydrogenase family protein [Legionella birminghamensis]KTC67979.1 UDP-glucose 6-dehydrogenase [Legionella birminghamensis]STX31312.1 UDP-glucose 6-dehydrogenase [Legionella birminghamensis]